MNWWLECMIALSYAQILPLCLHHHLWVPREWHYIITPIFWLIHSPGNSPPHTPASTLLFIYTWMLFSTIPPSTQSRWSSPTSSVVSCTFSSLSFSLSSPCNSCLTLIQHFTLWNNVNILFAYLGTYFYSVIGCHISLYLWKPFRKERVFLTVHALNMSS